MTQPKETPNTILTLTLPTPEGGGIAPERATATLLIQRGDLAHVRQFHYNGQLADLITAIREATIELGLLEDHPPIIPEAPKNPPKTEAKPKPATKKAAATPAVEEEPTIDIPLRKGTKAVRISHLKIVGGETDAAAYKQAVLIAAKLIDGGLWDGASPIRIDDVYATMRKMKHLTNAEMGLFSLTDFVQLGVGGLSQDAANVRAGAPEENDQDILEVASVTMPVSLNGFHPDDESE
jgi:hypothetical protein